MGYPPPSENPPSGTSVWTGWPEAALAYALRFVALKARKVPWLRRRMDALFVGQHGFVEDDVLDREFASIRERCRRAE